LATSPNGHQDLNGSRETSTAQVWQPRWADPLAWVVLWIVACVAMLTFRDYGLGWDDYTHSQYGSLLLSFYGSGLKDTRALSFVNLYYYGGGFDMAAALLAKILPFDLFETRRLAGAIVGIVGLFATWRTARHIGGPFAGLMALALLATCPLYYGHMFINPKDAPFAAAMAVFLLGVVRMLEQYPEPSRATLLIVGAGFGAAIGSRILAGFGVIEAVAALAFVFALEARENVRSAAKRLARLMLALVPAALLAYALMALLWPWSVENPLNPFKALIYFSHFFETPWRELFQGTLLQPTEMPRRYVLVLLGAQLPLLFIALGLIGLCSALLATVQNGIPGRAIALALALAVILPVAITVITRPAMYNGIRHFIFVLPPLAVAGGLAATRIAEWSERLRAPLLALIVAGSALPALGMAKLHPYEYAYFNEAAGGVSGAQSRYMLDYWGLAFKQAGDALRAKIASERLPGGRKWKVAVCGPHPPARVALGDNFDLSWDARDADFGLTLGSFYCAKLDAPLLIEIVRDGVVFARAYDIRGRKIDSVFAMPPVEREPR
jgi:hypothetical protein